MHLLAFALLACENETNPIDTCDAPASGPRANDCCTEDAQCVAVYGSDFPFCLHGSRPAGGICGECKTDRDCDGRKSVCLEAANGLTQCVDPDACYVTSQTGYYGACTY